MENTSDEEQKNEQKDEFEEEKENYRDVKETPFKVTSVNNICKAYHHKPLNNAQPLVGFQKTDIKICLFFL